MRHLRLLVAGAAAAITAAALLLGGLTARGTTTAQPKADAQSAQTMQAKL